MQSFVNSQRMWESGVRRAHVYLLPDRYVDTGLARLIEQARSALAGHDCVSFVDDEWLHVTVAMVTDPDADRETFVDEVRRQVREVPPFTMRMGSVIAGASAVVIDADGDGDAADEETGGFTRLAEAVDRAVDVVAGGTTFDPFPPHLTIGYGRSDSCDSGPLGSALRKACRPPWATLRVTQAVVVDVAHDPVEVTCTWTELERVPLLG